MGVALQQERWQLTTEALDAQSEHWERTLAEHPDMYGVEPSWPARKAADIFIREGITKVLELGGGQGRDTIFFARSGLQVHVLEYTEVGVKAISKKAQEVDLAGRIVAMRHDVRKPLPFGDKSFDACYSHMLFCMALATPELERLFSEVRRVLKPGGLNIYTVRHIRDPHYGTGIHRGENMYEVGGFIVHFFSKQKVETLARGYHLVDTEEFEEGELPRRLLRVTLRKEG
jgi:SAM-dependent methyltransferase